MRGETLTKLLEKYAVIATFSILCRIVRGETYKLLLQFYPAIPSFSILCRIVRGETESYHGGRIEALFYFQYPLSDREG